MLNKTYVLAALVVLVPFAAIGQDTLTISMEEFIRRGAENSGQLDFEEQNVRLASNRIDQARSQRYLPQFELSTQHGVVPGVESDRNDLTENEYYLDPNLENDWQEWGVFTRAEVSAVQPLFTWGALSNAVKAAESAAESARKEFESRKADISLRLYELYQSYVLTRELERLLSEASERIARINRQIEEQREAGDSELDESDVYKFRVFQSEFEARAAEVRENSAYIRRVWDYVLQPDSGEVFVPEGRYMEPVANELQDVGYYRAQAMNARAEIQSIEHGIEAARQGLSATRSRAFPTFFLGISGSYANTPNRPRQSNPFIINNTNYATAAVGMGIRQNLDFFQINTEIERSRIQYNQAQHLKSAAEDGIVLELNDRYRNASISRSKIESLDEALGTTKEWLRQEQLDYDLGFGETKDLLDALRKELELRVQIQQLTFEHNRDMARLYRSAGIALTQLHMNQP